VRSLVLDSVYPPDPLPPRSTIRAAALTAFFDTCENDARCAGSYPKLSEIFAATLHELRKAPLLLDVPPELRQPDGRVLLTSTLFEFIVGNQIYYPRYYAGLPRLIVAVHDRNTEELGLATAAMALEATQSNIPDSRATNAAVECRDRPHFRAPLARDASPLDEVHLFGVCADWSDLGPPPLVPVGTTIPTLVLSGQFDPVAGPALSRQIAATIGPHALLVGFPRLGHNVRFFSRCATGIVSNFIDHPEITPDTTCAIQRPPIPFVLTSEKH
jgi:pimeloyl-ACP methyl ester carboxylesterase